MCSALPEFTALEDLKKVFSKNTAHKNLNFVGMGTV